MLVITPEGRVTYVYSLLDKDEVGVNDNELLAIVTELPIPKFSTTVPSNPPVLMVILPLPALIF